MHRPRLHHERLEPGRDGADLVGVEARGAGGVVRDGVGGSGHEHTLGNRGGCQVAPLTYHAHVAFDRNGLEIIGESDCWLLLGAAHIGRLGVCLGGRAEIFPINFVVDGTDEHRSIVFLTSPGSKLAGAILGGQVAFEVDAADPLFHTGWSVVVHGDATEVERLDDLMVAEELALRPWGPTEKRNYVRIVPSSVTGRRILPARGA